MLPVSWTEKQLCKYVHIYPLWHLTTCTKHSSAQSKGWLKARTWQQRAWRPEVSCWKAFPWPWKAFPWPVDASRRRGRKRRASSHERYWWCSGIHRHQWGSDWRERWGRKPWTHSFAFRCQRLIGERVLQHKETGKLGEGKGTSPVPPGPLSCGCDTS